MHHVVDQNTLLVLKFFNTHRNFITMKKIFLANSVIYVSFNIKKLPRLIITSNKTLINCKQDILDVFRKTNPVLDDLNIYLVIDSKKQKTNLKIN